MTKSNCIITCEFDMTEYARLFTYEALTEDTCAVTGYVGTETASLLIPSADPEGRTVVAIGDRAFEGCSDLHTVLLPDCNTSIGRSIFASCDSLSVLVLPEEAKPFLRRRRERCKGRDTL